MLDSLVIKNFRVIDALEIARLGRINLILGFNNSGKSCLLEALEIYGNQARDSTLRRQVQMRKEDFVSEDYPLSVFEHPFRCFFPGFQFKENTSIEIGPKSNAGATLKLSLAGFDSERYQGLYLERSWGEEKLRPLNLNQDLENIRLRVGVTYEKENVSPGQLSLFASEPLPTYLISTKADDRYFHSQWDAVSLHPDRREMVFDAMRMIEPDLDQIVMIGQAVRMVPIVLYRNSKNKVPLASLGDGMNRLFRIVVALVNAAGRTLLIDEVENGLHYTILPLLWQLIYRVAKQHDIQVFATTHSWDAVTAFQKLKVQNRNDLLLTRLARKATKGAIDEFLVQTFDQQEMQLAGQMDMELR